MKASRILLLATLVSTAWLAASCDSANAQSAVNPKVVLITRKDDRLRVELNGKFFTEYYYTNVPRPFCYPITGPSGVAMTRNFPMTNAPAEEQDHPHHRSLWFAHDPVNGNDMWTERKGTGTIVHRGFAETLSGTDVGVIKTLNDWIAADGKLLCTDEQTLRFHAPKDDVIMLDFEIILHASNGDVTFGDSKEGTFAVRVAETMRLKPNKFNGDKPTGHIVNSEGVRDDKTWGKRAAWCDYYGPVDGKTVGIAIFDNPANPRYPTWWHVRDYGLFAANPFGQHDFESLPDKQAGNFKIPAGQSATFRYRVVLHDGDEKAGRIAARYTDYVKDSSTKTK